jgi:two-component system C4-dicarboxylate transport response regulator DctD
VTGGSALDELLATSPSLVAELRVAARGAATEAPILILGEPGSGRSTLARALHSVSSRAAGPLVEVDVALGPPALFESELFGHRAGAFTGATADRAGRVERAAGGTLLLDHVEEMPLAAQAKLLRLVAEGRYAPVGGDDRPAHVRFMAIAAADLEGRVARGAFREDLFYRLEVLTVRLPPLRRRHGDLDTLIDALLADLGERFHRPGLELMPAARQWMTHYSWPGNVRELRNLLERAVLSQASARLDPPPPRGGAGRPRPLAEVERREIERALAWTRGHQGRAAELLGISRKALWQKRRRYGLP